MGPGPWRLGGQGCTFLKCTGCLCQSLASTLPFYPLQTLMVLGPGSIQSYQFEGDPTHKIIKCDDTISLKVSFLFGGMTPQRLCMSIRVAYYARGLLCNSFLGYSQHIWGSNGTLAPRQVTLVDANIFWRKCICRLTNYSSVVLFTWSEALAFVTPSGRHRSWVICQCIHISDSP